MLSLGNVAVDEGNELKFFGQPPSGGQKAELLDAGFEGFSRLLLQAGEEGVGGAEVGEDDLAGLSIDTLGGDDLPVAVAMDGFGCKGSHD